MKKADLELIQQKINYTFSNQKLLEQAFTTKAFASKNPECKDYELLEFFGDKALSYVLAKEYASYFCKIKKKQLCSNETECSLTQRNSELIKNDNLAQRIQETGLNDFLQKLPSEGILGKREGDLFESILGAVAVDSDWNDKALQSVVDVLLNPLENFEKQEYEKESFIVILKNLCKKYGIQITNFQIYVNKDGTYTSKVTLECEDNQKKFTQKAKTEIGAKLSVARTAYLYIVKFWLYQPAQEWIENPVSQLNSLRQNKWIESVKYQCNQIMPSEKIPFGGVPSDSMLSAPRSLVDIPAGAEKDDRLKPEWSCTCTVERSEGKTLVVSVEKPSMKKAKNAAAFKALCMILNQIREEQTGRGKGLLRLILEKYI